MKKGLSVDRNSFRETDSHYIALREHLWKLLGSTTREDGIMGMSVDAYWKRRERREKQALREHIQKLAEQVQRTSKGKLTLDFSEQDKPHPYILEDDEITVYDGSPSWPRSSSDRRLYQQLLIPVRAAVAAGASAEQVLALLEKILLKQ